MSGTAAAMEVAMGAAQRAAFEAIAGLGLTPPAAVVVNAAWQDDDGGEFAAGSAVPGHAPAILAESLRASAEEAES